MKYGDRCLLIQVLEIQQFPPSDFFPVVKSFQPIIVITKNRPHLHSYYSVPVGNVGNCACLEEHPRAWCILLYSHGVKNKGNNHCFCAIQFCLHPFPGNLNLRLSAPKPVLTVSGFDVSRGIPPPLYNS